MTKFDHRCKQSSKEDFIFRELKKKQLSIFIAKFLYFKISRKTNKESICFLLLYQKAISATAKILIAILI